MATSFPGALDSFTNPSASDALDSATVGHAGQHADLNDAVEALEAKVGADGSAVTSSLDYKVANQGLTFVKSQTIGSGVSSVTVTGAFSSTFDNYRIVINGFISSVANAGHRLRIGGDTSGNYYYGGPYVRYSGTTGFNTSSGFSSWECGTGDTTTSSTIFDVTGPYLSGYTTYHTMPALSGNTSGYVIMFGGVHRVASSYTSFVLFPSTGVYNGGTIRVYGYNNG